MISLSLPYKAYLSFKAYLVTIEINIRVSFAWTLDGMVDIIENYDTILESVEQFYIKFGNRIPLSIKANLMDARKIDTKPKN